MNIKVVGINASNFGCTGYINLGILELAKKDGMKTFSVCAKSRTTIKNKYDNQIFVGNIISRNIQLKYNYYSGYQLPGSYLATEKLIAKLEKIKPDIIHFHIMHGSYINLRSLIKYINNNNIKVVWTMHDCWAFTGQCAYFEMADCYKWENDKCYKCVQLHRYPASKWFDRAKINYEQKRKLFTSIRNMQIVTPSNWLARYVKRSFLKNYPVSVIYNGIDTKFFHPRETDIRARYNLEDKFIVLGCAAGWEKRKGIDFFVRLAMEKIDRIKVVLIGVDNILSKEIPDNILSVQKTSSRDEMAEWYSIADVFLNPTLEDNFPTVNIEALSCGLPVITFNTGGSPEALDEYSGIIVEKGNYEKLKDSVVNFMNGKYENISREKCIERAKIFNQEMAFKSYVDLYKMLVSGEEYIND